MPASRTTPSRPHSHTRPLLRQRSSRTPSAPPTDWRVPQASQRALEAAEDSQRMRSAGWDTDFGSTPYSSMDLLLDYLSKPGKLALYQGGTYRGRVQSKREWAADASRYLLTHTYPKVRESVHIESKMRGLVQSYRKARDWICQTGQGGGKRLRDRIDDEGDSEEQAMLEEQYSDQLYRLCKYYDALHPLLQEREGGTDTLRTDTVTGGGSITIAALLRPSRDLSPASEANLVDSLATLNDVGGEDESQTPGDEAGTAEIGDIGTQESGLDGEDQGDGSEPTMGPPSLSSASTTGRRDGRGRRLRGQTSGVNDLERALLAATGQENDTRLKAVEMQRQQVEISRSQMQLNQQAIELDRHRTAAQIATERIRSGDVSVTWLQAYKEAQVMIREPVEIPGPARRHTRSRSRSRSSTSL